MKEMHWLILILLVCLISCKDTQSSSITAPVANNSGSMQPTQSVSIEAILALPDNFHPTYKIAQMRDVSFDNVRRYVVSLKLPTNLKKEEVEQNFKHAILYTYKEKAPNAITIWGYQDGDDINQPFTVGDAVFAPHGKWESAGESEGGLQNYQTIINVKDSYLNTKNDLSVGDEVTLTAYKSSR
jgi:hypothetical protein